jgi:hypothetical protein
MFTGGATPNNQTGVTGQYLLPPATMDTQQAASGEQEKSKGVIGKLLGGIKDNAGRLALGGALLTGLGLLGGLGPAMLVAGLGGMLHNRLKGNDNQQANQEQMQQQMQQQQTAQMAQYQMGNEGMPAMGQYGSMQGMGGPMDGQNQMQGMGSPMEGQNQMQGMPNHHADSKNNLMAQMMMQMMDSPLMQNPLMARMMMETAGAVGMGGQMDAQGMGGQMNEQGMFAAQSPPGQQQVTLPNGQNSSTDFSAIQLDPSLKPVFAQVDMGGGFTTYTGDGQNMLASRQDESGQWYFDAVIGQNDGNNVMRGVDNTGIGSGSVKPNDQDFNAIEFENGTIHESKDIKEAEEGQVKTFTRDGNHQILASVDQESGRLIPEEVIGKNMGTTENPVFVPLDHESGNGNGNGSTTVNAQYETTTAGNAAPIGGPAKKEAGNAAPIGGPEKKEAGNAAPAQPA